MKRLCFLFSAKTGILPGSCLAIAYLFCYAIVYSTVFGAVFGVHIVGVGWAKIMLKWDLNSYY